MTTRRRFLTGLSIGAVATTAGCSELQQMIGEPPIDDLDLEIADVRAPSIGLTSATIPIVMELENTNDSAELPSPIIDITASVNDEDVLEAREQIPTLGPGDSASEQFDIQVGYSEIGSSIFNAIEAGEFQIVVEGEVESDGTSVDFADEYTY